MNLQFSFRGLVTTALLLGTAALASQVAMGQSGTFSGVVFEDQNNNLMRDEGEPGVANVSVSNGIQVVQTDADGAYTLPVRDEMVVFVTKPIGYMVAVDENNVPRFSYIHRPNGSPDFIQEYRGIEPTGELPASVDFPLYPYDEPAQFDFIVYGDTQVSDHKELGYLRDGAIAELSTSEALFGIAVGDLVNDPLALYPRYQQVMGAAGFPTWYVVGNHDLNFDSVDDRYHTETYIRNFGAPYYSFSYGDVHVVVLENIRWNVDPGHEGTYNARTSDEQLEWLANDLQFVPEDKLIVIATHIGLNNWIDRDAERHQDKAREQIYEIMARYDNVFSISGHSHTLERLRPGEEYTPADPEAYGWAGPIPFPQFVAGAVCGSWWTDEENAFGLPYSYQRDGAPPGYMIFSIDGNSYSEVYKPVGSDATMHISFDYSRTGFIDMGRGVFDDLGILTRAELDGTRVIANVYSGGHDTQVTMQINDGEPMPMERNLNQADPFALSLQEGLEDWLQTVAGNSNHIYTASLPIDLPVGTHIITIRAVDPYGQEHIGTAAFDVWATN